MFGVWTSCNPSPVPPAGLSPGFPSHTQGGREGSRTSRLRPAGPSLSLLITASMRRRLPRACCGVLLPPGTPASPPGRCAVITASFKEERRSSCRVGSSPAVNAMMPLYFHMMTYVPRIWLRQPSSERSRHWPRVTQPSSGRAQGQIPSFWFSAAVLHLRPEAGEAVFLG